MRFLVKTSLLLVGIGALAGAGCLAEPEVATTSAEVTTPITLAQARTHYGLTALGAGRQIGIIAVKGTHPYPAVLTDLQMARTASSFGPGVTPTLHTQTGASILPPAFAVFDASMAQDIAAAVQWSNAAAPSSKPLVFLADSFNPSDIATTLQNALAALPTGSQVIVLPSMAETHPIVPAVESLLAANPTKLVLAPAGERLYPASSPRVLSVGTTEISPLGVEVAYSLGRQSCSAVFARGATCAADVAARAQQMEVYFGGAVTVVDSKIAPTALWGGRIALQGASVTRLQVLGGNPLFRQDITAGSDALGNPAVAGSDIPTGIGIPQGNLSF